MSKATVEEYKKINLEISNRIIALSLTVIAAIFVISEKYGVQRCYLIALLGFVLTIGTNLVSCICSSKHYELVIDGRIADEDFRKSGWGLWAEWLYWLFIILFVISIIFFVIAIVGSIDIIDRSSAISK